jgi:hypothetical protein
MGIGNCRIVAALILIPSCLRSGYDAAIDTITSSQPIKDPETVSAGNIEYPLHRFQMMGINPVMQGSSKGIILWRSFADDETARSFDLSGAVPHLYGRTSLFPRKLIA